MTSQARSERFRSVIKSITDLLSFVVAGDKCKELREKVLRDREAQHSFMKMTVPHRNLVKHEMIFHDLETVEVLILVSSHLVRLVRTPHGKCCAKPDSSTTVVAALPCRLDISNVRVLFVSMPRQQNWTASCFLILLGFAKPAMLPGTRQGHGDGSSKGCRCLCKKRLSL